MAEFDDLMDEERELPPPAAAQSPVLQEFAGIFTNPAAKEWAGEMAARINDYTTRRQIADDNIAAGENFVADMDQFKSGLISGVRSDPFFVHTALDLVTPTLRALTGAMPNAPEDVDAHNAALAGHMQREIATAAVTMLAETHEGAARGMLADQRIAGLLGDAVQPLDGYIGAQAQARAIDREAEARNVAAYEALAADTTATNYLASLIDPISNTVQFPPGFNQGVLADPRLPPPVKAGVLGVYERLAANGDIERSDPYVVTAAIRRAANGEPPPAGELLQHAGADLTLKDALSLTRKLSISPAAKIEAQQMMATLDTARRILSPPEYGAAGQAAYGRFADWFLDEYDRRGPVSLNPASPNWILGGTDVAGSDPVSRFMPSGTDVVLGIRPQSRLDNTIDRPSLHDIFGGRPLPSPGDIRERDIVIPTPRIARPHGNQGEIGARANPQGEIGASVNSGKLFDMTDRFVAETATPEGGVDLNRLETDESLKYEARQAVDKEALINAIMRKYQLGPTAKEQAEEYADELRTFSNPTRGPNQ
jgi:hypothetical protein